MAAGDEFGLSEDLYQQLIGRYVASIEVLSKRIFAKDRHIAELETENAHLEAQVAKFLSEPPLELNKQEDIEVYYGDTPPTTPAPKRKK